ncbi:right-handed parallel beta-helix repeat-containing protein [Amycolatopsis nigrescens]|uniref:right-handed parallel beta-helix repeat-containing protein n=1 Tax=Amycolatopsis nigrescens TaxID=381445 RepID=UPI000377C05F|nr:right-handed parallel beta-helix repeat-containing protein [Amycolatopsis nigrescens]
MSRISRAAVAIAGSGALVLAIAPGVSAAPGDVPVSTAEQLTAALANAKPGDNIQLADGKYDGVFFVLADGTESEPITLTGSRQAVLSNSDGGCDPNVPDGREVSYCGYGLHLNGAEHWRLNGFSVTGSAKGIVLDNSSGNVLDDVEVSGTGDEGVHFRANSDDNVIQNSFVHDTGKKQPQYGEALYFGSAVSNWQKYGDSPGGPDTSDRNRALKNKLGPNVAADHLDIKEGTTGGAVLGNSFDGIGMTGENSSGQWVATKGNDYEVSDNTGVKSFENGFKATEQEPGWGCGNVFHRNHADVQADGYGFHLPHQKRCPADKLNQVYRDNVVQNAGAGFSNIDPIG